MGLPQIVPITPAIGAEVFDADLASAVHDDELADTIRQAILDHHVLVFRNQDITREQHKAFGRLFGPLHIHASQRGRHYQGDREIFPVHADASTVLNNGGLWHSDVSCDEMPPLGSMLLLREAPEHGGDTVFANMHLAYETLSAPLRDLLDQLDAVHDMASDLGNYGIELRPDFEYPRHTHPLAPVHPETGRKLVFANTAFTTHIEGLSKAESDMLLALLFEHTANNPALHCRVRWEPGTLTFWDNRCVQHYAVWDYRPQVRSGDRVTIASTVAPARTVPLAST